MAQLVRPEGLTLDRQEALRYVGYNGQAIDDALLGRFELLAQACDQDLSPAGVWESFAIEQVTQTGVKLASGLVLEGTDIAAHLAKAKEAVLLACTLGFESERELRKYAATSAVDGMLYGACASALVESLANAVEASVVAYATERGLRTNFRYSPGYGDLPLDVQPGFIRALQATVRIGLTCTPDNFLVPTKSITAVMGLFDAAATILDEGSRCSACQLRYHCELRKKGTSCHGR